MSKKIMSKVAFAAAGVAAIASVVATPSLVSAWGDSAGGRPTYTVADINNGAISGNTVVFNSITDSVIGDERNFVSALESTADVKGYWNGNEIKVENGKEYLVRIYVHNNNPNGTAAVAENTKVAFNIPSTSGTTVRVNGYITSSNATPNKYWDYVDFTADTSFHLEYVYGSALLQNNGIGAGNGVKLSDEIVTNAANYGTLIGYNALDGKVPGCYKYDNFVTIRVKAVYDADFIVDKKVRLVGTTEWSDSVEANVGDQVEFQIQYKNTSTEGKTHYNVIMRDILPNNMKYVAGTTRIWNSNYKGETVNPDGAIVDDGIEIGHYAPNANAYVRFTAEVIDKDLACGSNTLVNWARSTVDTTAAQDYAVVHLNKVCAETPETETPTQLPSTGPEAIAGGVIATGSIVTAAGYFIASRRALR